MLISSPAPLTESYWTQWRSSSGEIVFCVNSKEKWNWYFLFCANCNVWIFCIDEGKVSSAQANRQGSGDWGLGPTSTDLLPRSKARSWTACAELRWDGDACVGLVIKVSKFLTHFWVKPQVTPTSTCSSSDLSTTSFSHISTKLLLSTWTWNSGWYHQTKKVCTFEISELLYWW